MVVFTLLLVLGISSCGKPELKKIRGIVKNVRIDDDTLKNGSPVKVCGLGIDLH